MASISTNLGMAEMAQSPTNNDANGARKCDYCDACQLEIHSDSLPWTFLMVAPPRPAHSSAFVLQRVGHTGCLIAYPRNENDRSILRRTQPGCELREARSESPEKAGVDEEGRRSAPTP